MASTVMKMAMPGVTQSKGRPSNAEIEVAWCNIRPQLGIGSCTPTPMKLNCSVHLSYRGMRNL